MSSPESSEKNLRDRLDRLSASLERENKAQAEAAKPPASDNSNIGLVFRFASEFVAGVLVGAGLGWGIDKLAGTTPIFLITFLLIGFAAALTNMVRVAKAAQAKTPLGNDVPDDVDDDE